MEYCKIKCLMLVIFFIIIYLYYNKKETFENLDTFIKNTNNGQWNFSSYNPYANLNEYTDSIIFIYNDDNNPTLEGLNIKER